MKAIRFLSATALAGAVSILPAVAIAQASTPATAESAEGSEIIVTGSRISRPNLDSTIPVTSVGSEQIMDSGQISVGDQLNQLPQLRSTFSQANSTRFIGTAGQNFLDLRGLGTERTLTLINGRRQVSSAPGSFRWDTNNVPADLIERVDVVTGGNSAIYGSDAIAGVVNFVLKRSFDGFQVRGQAGVSDRGDSGSQFLSGVAGMNFSEGRGNVTFAAEYARQEALYITDREQGRNRQQFQLVQNLGPITNPFAGVPVRGTPEPSTGDGIPDTQFIGGLVRTNTSVGGLFAAACPTVAAAGESAAAFAARQGRACSGIVNPGGTTAANQFGNLFVFQPDGNLVSAGCTRDFRPFGSGNCQGGLGSTLRESGQFQPYLKRINLTFLGRYEISPAFEPFVEAKYVHVDAIQEGAPTFGTIAQMTQQNIAYSIDNPFLTPQARATLVGLLAPGTTTFQAERQNLDFGARGEKHVRDLYSGVVGARGTFNDNWKYEVAASYGRFTSYYETQGNFIRSRLANSVNAVLAPTGYTGPFALNQAGQRVACAINTDASTTNDDAACIPVNLFGAGNVSQAALNYFGYTSYRNQKAEQFIVNGFISGDTGKFFNLPGGPVGFAVGAEYRAETQSSIYDPITSAAVPVSNTFLNIIAPFAPPTYRVKEAFGEIRIPLLADTAFAHELTVEAAGRVSDYNLGTTGTVFAWNAGVTYAPIKDIRIRASYQRSIRAPSLGDLFTQPTQTFNNSLQDPCSQNFINNNPNRVRNCAAAGVPTTQTFGGTTEPFSNLPASGVSAANQGNPLLRAEKGSSWTVGAVLQPQALPGLSVSVDYYNIRINDVIFTLTPQKVLELCYDSTTGIDNFFCRQVTRLPNGTFAGQANVRHAGATVTLNNTGFSSLGQPFNYAKQETSGIDVDINYSFAFNEDITLTTRGIVSYLINRDAYPDITDPTFRDRIKSELGDPEWRFQMSTQLKVGSVTVGHKMQYIGKQILFLSGNGQYETFFGIDGRAPLDPDAAPFAYYSPQWYHDFRLEIDATERFKFYAGVDNVFDRLPPLDLLGTEAGSPYDPTGRFFYAGFRAKF